MHFERVFYGSLWPCGSHQIVYFTDRKAEHMFFFAPWDTIILNKTDMIFLRERFITFHFYLTNRKAEHMFSIISKPRYYVEMFSSGFYLSMQIWMHYFFIFLNKRKSRTNVLLFFACFQEDNVCYLKYFIFTWQIGKRNKRSFLLHQNVIIWKKRVFHILFFLDFFEAFVLYLSQQIEKKNCWPTEFLQKAISNSKTQDCPDAKRTK